MSIERIGISLEKPLLDAFDKLIESKGYQNRSEAVRDLIREQIDHEELADPDAQAVGGVFLVYDHQHTSLSDRLLKLQHNHLLHVITSTHIHLDHHNCLEIIILRGLVSDIQKLADSMAALKGVKLSRVNLISTDDGEHCGHNH